MEQKCGNCLWLVSKSNKCVNRFFPFWVEKMLEDMESDMGDATIMNPEKDGVICDTFKIKTIKREK